jgi:ABC-type glutathione transport system ATPase component
VCFLEVRNLTVTAGRGRPILADVDIAIRHNRITCLWGESGAGKTVLARTISGLMPENMSIQSGQFVLAGSPAAYEGLKKVRGREIFYCPQDAAACLNPVLKIKRQFRDVVRDGDRQAVTILAGLGFTAPERILNAYPFELSGGEARRCLLALSILLRPGLLILDEPFTALDPDLKGELAQLLKRIQEEYRLCLFIITHHLAIVREISHFGYSISAGRVAVEISLGC